MARKKLERLMTVEVQGHAHTIMANSPQHACRQAFRFLIKNGLLKRQPKSTDDGGFEGTTVTIQE